MKLSFYGGVKVTSGANYLLETQKMKILIDCGLHQGSRYAERLNFEPFPYDPKTIDAVLITHAHIDHTGLLPKLVKNGFRGKIFSTAPTADLTHLFLEDSHHILGEEAKDFKMPELYDLNDLAKLMTLWLSVEYRMPFDIAPGMRAIFHDAGHILGSSFIFVETEGKKIIFSGDVGNSPAPLLKPTEALPHIDYLVTESTYGDRIHEDLAERREILEDTIEETVSRGGVLMIPAFAMERTQELLYEIDQLVDQRRIPPAPIFLDSPLAIRATDVYQKYVSFYNPETQALLVDHSIFQFKNLKKTLTKEESKAINEVRPPKIIIAGAGMSQGGRILHHEKRYLPDPNSMLLIIGYQGKGSLGRRLLDGEKEVKIHGEEIAVRAHIKAIGGYSAHADQHQLLRWIHPQRQELKRVFVVQGEDEASAALQRKIIDELAVDAMVPGQMQSFEL